MKKDLAEEEKERRLTGEILALEQMLPVEDQRTQAFSRLSARRVSRGLAMGASERTKDAEYLRLLAAFRVPRTGPRSGIQ